jgi:hypothetical protein
MVQICVRVPLLLTIANGACAASGSEPAVLGARHDVGADVRRILDIAATKRIGQAERLASFPHLARSRHESFGQVSVAMHRSNRPLVR